MSITLFAAKESNKEIESLLGDRCKFEKIVCYENSDNIERNVQFEDIDWKSFDGIFFASLTFPNVPSPIVFIIS